MRQKYTLDGMLIPLRAQYAHIYNHSHQGNFSVANPPSGMAVEVGGK